MVKSTYNFLSKTEKLKNEKLKNSKNQKLKNSKTPKNRRIESKKEIIRSHLNMIAAKAFAVAAL